MNKGVSMNRSPSFVLASLIAAFAASGTAFAVSEVEPNQGPLVAVTTTSSTGAGPQALSKPGDLSIVTEGTITPVTGVIGRLSGTAQPDVDVFTFFAEKGRIVTIHIEAPTGGLVSFDGILTLFSPLEDGSKNKAESFATTTSDPIIEKFEFDQNGTWAIALSPFNMTFGDGGQLEAGSSFLRTNGAYKLVITGLAPRIVVQQVSLAVKPGSGGRAPINPKAKGNIPVALLSAEDFDPLAVDVNSLTFGATGDEPSLRSCTRATVDFNGDGRPDLLCHFDNEIANFVPGNAEAFLKGTVNDPSARGARPILGRGPLKAVPAKRSN